MATITARVDDDVKLGLEQFADEVGTSVSGLINMRARRVLKTKQFTIGFGDESDVQYLDVHEPIQDVLSQMYAIQGKNG